MEVEWKNIWIQVAETVAAQVQRFCTNVKHLFLNLRTVSEFIQYPATKITVDNDNSTCKGAVSRDGYFSKLYKTKSIGTFSVTPVC